MAAIQRAVLGLEVSKSLIDKERTARDLENAQVCETCAIGRQHKETMTGMREKVKDLLECKHSDVCRPMQTPTLSGELYFVTFVDEALGRLAVTLLHLKAEVFKNFAVYCQHAEKETGKAVRSLCSDGGGEYMSEKFLTYVCEAGIVKKPTPPYTPAQNGIAERANRTIMEAARCMLTDAHLGNEFWGYAVLAATHILNQMPSREHKGRSPIEVWTGAKPSITHFRVFGCLAHILVLAETRRKLDPKSVTGMFVGYAEDQGARVYKLYHEETKRVITS